MLDKDGEQIENPQRRQWIFKGEYIIYGARVIADELANLLKTSLEIRDLFKLVEKLTYRCTTIPLFKGFFCPLKCFLHVC